jgi:hypothetical protein
MKKMFLLALFVGSAGLVYLYKKYKSVAELKVFWDDET